MNFGKARIDTDQYLAIRQKEYFKRGYYLPSKSFVVHSTLRTKPIRERRERTKSVLFGGVQNILKLNAIVKNTG